MKQRNKVIIALIVFGIILSAVVYGIIIPKINENKQKYANAQMNPETHDLESILKYKNKYMGNTSNSINLFYSLPLSNVGMSFENYPETFTLEVNYKETVWGIGEKNVNKTIIYNSTAAFALIDNLNEIHYNFTGKSYKVLRSDVEKWYGVKLSSMLKKDVWKSKVQKKLKDNEYVQNCINAILNKNKIYAFSSK